VEWIILDQDNDRVLLIFKTTREGYVATSGNVNLIQIMVALRFLQRGAYLVFSDFTKDSATEIPHLEVISQKKNHDVPPKRRKNQINHTF
jgi:hypothetical protein